MYSLASYAPSQVEEATESKRMSYIAVSFSKQLPTIAKTFTRMSSILKPCNINKVEYDANEAALLYERVYKAI